MKLETAYQICEEVVRRHSSSFYRAFSLLPKEDRNAVWAVYAFCRTVDDIVDETPEAAPQLLENFAVDFQQMLEGCTPNHPHWMALEDVFRRYPMDPEPFWHMLQGQHMDLEPLEYRTMEELELYCYHVAGTVGLMLLPILAPVVTEEMKQQAIHLGVAMQITNILRDVREDYGRGRVYLPMDLMDATGYKPGDISYGSTASGWSLLFRELGAKADHEYRRGLAGLRYYPRRSRLALSAAASIYREILQEARRRGGDVFTERVRVSSGRKLVLLGGLLLKPITWQGASTALVQPAASSDVHHSTGVTSGAGASAAAAQGRLSC